MSTQCFGLKSWLTGDMVSGVGSGWLIDMLCTREYTKSRLCRPFSFFQFAFNFNGMLPARPQPGNSIDSVIMAMVVTSSDILSQMLGFSAAAIDDAYGAGSCHRYWHWNSGGL